MNHGPTSSKRAVDAAFRGNGQALPRSGEGSDWLRGSGLGIGSAPRLERAKAGEGHRKELRVRHLFFSELHRQAPFFGETRINLLFVHRPSPLKRYLPRTVPTDCAHSGKLRDRYE